MPVSAILTVLGWDRPGLTKALAEAVTAAGGNWLESHLSSLRGMFTGSILIELPRDRLDALQQDLGTIQATGLQVTLLEVEPAPEVEAAGLVLELVGQDRPGIVHEVTSALSAVNVNIVSFASHVENSSWSGQLLFRARAELAKPAGMSDREVQEAVERISSEVMVDLEPLDDGDRVTLRDFA